MKKFMKKSSGFTLVELLVVIVIIGILSTITVGTFRGHFAKARDAKRTAEIHSLDLAIKTEFADSWDPAKRYIITSDTGTTPAAGSIQAILNSNEMTLKGEGGFCYAVVSGAGDSSSADSNRFLIAGWSEKDKAPMFAGSPASITGAESITLTEADFICASSAAIPAVAKLKVASVTGSNTTPVATGVGNLVDGNWQ